MKRGEKETRPLRYYTFCQNNVRGQFDMRGNVSAYVVIEAHDATEANAAAEEKGLYFDGVRAGLDCDCCGGDRWVRVRDDAGTDIPMIWDKPITLPWVTELGGVVIHTHDGGRHRIDA